MQPHDSKYRRKLHPRQMRVGNVESPKIYAVTIDFESIPVRTLNLEGLLKTKQTSRDKDKLDRVILERALEELKKV